MTAPETDHGKWFPGVPGGFVGVRGECYPLQTFYTERSRELWTKFHTHEEPQ